MLFAHLKSILKLNRLGLRGVTGVYDEFTLARIAQDLCCMAVIPPFLAAIGSRAG